MAGNVFEWTSSLLKPYPYDATDGRDLTRRGDRVIRGGAWNEGPNDQWTFYRSWIGPDLSESPTGFRCARSR
jgi:formylglycine-generating enzyme required for sulfatase activity